ncbi:MAG: shikimate kinase [Deltaproteobacteria bacterium]|nr:shikimate kinase [Deltaproteobacteria bacterium]
MITNPKKLIFLTGFMGAGKTSVGRILADLLSCRFIDLDQLIVETEQKTINEIFADKGETYFRECETTVLRHLSVEETAVCSTGGGIVLRTENREWMRQIGVIIYLRAEWSTLKKRLLLSRDRPLIKHESHESDWSDVKRLWEQRQTFYSAADLIIDTDNLAPKQVAKNIAAHLQKGNLIND